MFGHCVRVFYKDAFAKHGALLEDIGANPNNGLGDILAKVQKKLPKDKAKEVLADFESCYETRPWLAMVNSDKGITNLVRILLACALQRLECHLIAWFALHTARSVRYHH